MTFSEKWKVLCLLLSLHWVFKRHLFRINQAKLNLKVDQLSCKNSSKWSIARICASKFLENHEDRNNFMKEILFEDGVFKAWSPIEVKVYKIVLFKSFYSRFDCFSADLSLFVVILVKLKDEHHVELTIIDSLHDQRHHYVCIFSFSFTHCKFQALSDRIWRLWSALSFIHIISAFLISCSSLGAVYRLSSILSVLFILFYLLLTWYLINWDSSFLNDAWSLIHDKCLLLL